jgi:hypothetical protein
VDVVFAEHFPVQSSRSMRRLNVRSSQIEECIRTSLFAIDARPQNPPLETGEILLLQLVKEDAARLGKLDRRVEFALVLDRIVKDSDGSRSRTHWPQAGKVWRFILECSETIPAIPFSLERLPLSRGYGGLGNAQYIEPPDAAIIQSFLKGGMKAESLAAFAGVMPLLRTIRNYDTIARLSQPRTVPVREHDRRISDPWLSDALKALYDHKCQICTHDFRPRFGVPYADTRFLRAPKIAPDFVSKNLVVVCPNHRAIIGAAGATFDQHELAFVFPNGLTEKLLLRDHLLD